MFSVHCTCSVCSVRSVVQRAEEIPPRAENVNIFRPRCKHLVVFTMVGVNFFTTGGPLRTTPKNVVSAFRKGGLVTWLDEESLTLMVRVDQ